MTRPRSGLYAGFGRPPSERTPIDAEARGRLRVWKSAAAARSERLFETHNAPVQRKMVADMILKNPGKGRARAFAKLRATFAAYATLEFAKLDGPHPTALWVALRPREWQWIEPINPAMKQPCVLAEYLVAANLPPTATSGSGFWAGFWSIEVTEHALGRLLQRDRRADLDKVLLQAHRAALDIRCTDIVPCCDIGNPDEIRARSFLLPAGAGAFWCTLDAAHNPDDDDAVEFSVRASTWLHRDQLSPAQEAAILDVSRTNNSDPINDERLGDRLLKPRPLRPPHQLGSDTPVVVGDITIIPAPTPPTPPTPPTTPLPHRRNQHAYDSLVSA